MLVKNLTEFRRSMKETLDYIHENDDRVIISRSGDRDVVLLSLKEFNSMEETLYLLKSANNRKKLDQAIDDIENELNIVNKDVKE